MKFARFAAALGCAATLHAALLPVLHLDDKSLQAFDAYVAQFEQQSVAPFARSGALWADRAACCAGRAMPPRLIVEPRKNDDVASGSIHHYSGVTHVRRATIADIRRVMQNYPEYPRYFRPDVSKGAGESEPDSTPADEHYQSFLTLAESTLWFSVAFDCIYDTHYRRIDENRWYSRSASRSIKEFREPKHPEHGTYPEGDDHGFLWRTNTYWFARQTVDGLDLEADSITLSRPNVSGFAWWGAKRSHDAVEKMLRDTRAALEALHSTT